MFVSRKQDGNYTMFRENNTDGGNCVIKIKTDFLNNNKSLVNTQQFS